ncbi:MAG: carbamoyltransferase [Terriglobia bacterium]
MNILGVSCYYHDAAAALIRDGDLVAAAEEERFSRKKHDYGFPAHAIRFCLTQSGLSAGELDYVVFYEKPLVKFERILTTAVSTFPRSARMFPEAMIAWFDEKLWIRSSLMTHLGLPAERILFVDHHLAHAASAFFCSPFREAAILTVDGVGEWTTASLGTAKADWDGQGVNSIRLTQEIRFPHSLGLLYSAFTAFLGFEVNEGEYKVMGMAPYGQPRYVDKVHQLVRVADDGSFQLDMDYFSYQHSDSQTFSRRFVELFGEPRDSESEFITPQTHFDVSGREAEAKASQYFADVAASIQQVTEEILLKMARNLQRQTSLQALCMAGGVALNSVANGRILRESGFADLFIQPAAGDSGGAVGAALYAWHVVLAKPRKFVMEYAYWGQGFEAQEISDFLRKNGIPHEAYEDDEKLLSRLVEDLMAGKVAGWFQGRFEWGPRALGNRSILADPRRGDMKEIVNAKIKFREPFRPFAPVVPECRASGLFEGIPEPARHYPARFMLLVLPWKEIAGSQVPAVNHAGTGRLQTVRPEWNPRYHRLVELFGQATGTPVLMNTSFNLRGEPIVASPADAWNTFRDSGLDVLVIGNFVVRK